MGKVLYQAWHDALDDLELASPVRLDHGIYHHVRYIRPRNIRSCTVYTVDFGIRSNVYVDNL